MFDVGYSELLMIAIVALVVIGPKDLPRVMRRVGRMAGKARAMSRHLRAGFDEMMRQAELEDMEKEWAAHNARIMQEYPDADSTPAAPLTPFPAATIPPADPAPAEQPADPKDAAPIPAQPAPPPGESPAP